MHETLEGQYSQNTTCLEKMFYYKNETTCFGLYWPSSDFYSIKEEPIEDAKTL